MSDLMAMFVMDTNHVTEFAYSSAAGLRLRNRMLQTESEYATTGITVEEDLRGWALRKQGIRIGTQDLKIACIALAHDATVLTRNLVDFQQVPGLRVENWLD